MLSVGGAVVGLGAALAYSVKQAAEAQAVDAKLNAVLESTHGIAGMTATELDNMATSLSRMSTYDDEAIKGSEALLLTFTRIGSDVFPQAQQAILDLSTAMGGDLQGATIQLGKALNDPILGLTALTRVGVSFTAEQKDMIKALVESGDVMGAQKMILQELSTEFGGQALAASKTFGGQTTQLKNELGNLAEAIGTGLLPEITSLVGDVKNATIWITDNIEAIKKWANAIEWVMTPMAKLGQVMGMAIKDTQEDAEATGIAALAIREMGKDAAEATPEIETAITYFAGMAGTLRDETVPALDELTEATSEVSSANSNLLSLMGDLQSETDKYRDSAAELHDKQDQLRQDYVDGKVNAEEYAAQMGELTDAVKANEAAHEQAGRVIMFNLMQQKMAIGGLSTAETASLERMGVEWKIFDQATVNAAHTMMETAGTMDEQLGNISNSFQDPVGKMTQANEKLHALQNMAGQMWTYYVNIETTGSFPNLPSFSDSETRTTVSGNRYATGGEFVVPQQYGYEGFNMGNMASASGGETITITPRGASGAKNSGGGMTFNNAVINVHANNVDEFMMSLYGEL